MQATLLAEVIGAEEARFTERFSGKQDVAQELSAIRMSVEKLDSKIDQRAAEVKAELIRWVVSVGILQIALVAGLVLKFVR